MRFLKQSLSLFVCTLSLFMNLQSEIIEIHNMSEIHQYIKPNTLIVFDIDNTLLEPAQELGSDQWFYRQFEKYLESGMLLKSALNQTLAEWHAIQCLTKVNIVEEGTAKIIRNLQAEKFDIIGLTTRGLEMSRCTVDQLKTLHIDLSLNSPVKKDCFFINSNKGVLFHEGILFTTATHKGVAFFKLLDQIQYEPSHVVFINDKATHIRDLEETCEERNVPFVGLRYGFLDAKVKTFQMDVAEIQFQNFGKLLTDEEALNLLNSH